MLRFRTLHAAIVGAALCVGLSAATHGESETRATFSFIHMSDTHFEPYFQMPASLDGARSYECIRFAVEHMGDPVELEPYDVTAPPPSFVVITGDVAEYGFNDMTVKVADRYFEGLEIPMWWTTGNHDNTWMTHSNLWRERFGGMDYSFKHEGVHFISLNSASTQEPLPSFGRESVEFLRHKLAEIGTEDPVVVMFHHPLTPTGFGSTYGRDVVLDEMKPYNVVLVLVGHHHSRTAYDYAGIHAVHGGSTFSRPDADPPTDGFNVILVEHDRVTVAHRFKGHEKATHAMVQFPIPNGPQIPAVSVRSPQAENVYTDATLPIDAIIDPRGRTIVRAAAVLNDGDPVALNYQRNAAEGSVSLDGLINGAHFLRIEFVDGEGKVHSRSIPFFLERDGHAASGTAAWRYQMGGASKVAPLVVNGTVYAGSENAQFHAVAADSGELRWRFPTEGEITSSAAWFEGDPDDTTTRRIIFGTGAGTIHALRPNGQIAWTHTEPHGVFAPPTIGDDGVVYIGNVAAEMIALDAGTGELLWRNSDARYSVEAGVALTPESVIFGAWDGYVYALDRKTGDTIWQSAGPRNRERVVRYNGPADDPPVVAGDHLYVADRGYHAGVYTLAGDFLRTISETCSSIAFSPGGDALYLRHLNSPLEKRDLEGNVVWTSTAVGGRIPAPAVAHGGMVYLLDNLGTLHAIDDNNGTVKWQYQVVPHVHVFSVPTPADGVVYTVGTDGFLTAIAPPGGVVGAGR